MTMYRFFPAAFALLLALGSAAFGRLGENEVQSKSRYGEPVEGLVGADEKPLIAGAKELAYNFDGWRVRAAFVNGITHRIQYVKIPVGGKQPTPLTEAEMQALLDAEKGAYKWREEKPRTGYEGLDKLKEAFDGRLWERSDHADARLLLNIVMQFQSRDVEKVEKQLAKAASTPGKKATPAPVIPKF
jgi:hypothetical protein